jgi:thiol-disulfide isomerase/thioredoxin
MDLKKVYMRILFFIMLAALGFYYISKPKSGPATPITKAESLGTCQGKKQCAWVYMAPWCPACKQYTFFLSHAVKIAATQPEFGLQIVVGGERRPGDNQAMASELGPQTLIDQDNSIARDQGISYYPTFLVLDENGRPIMQDKPAFDWVVSTFQ